MTPPADTSIGIVAVHGVGHYDPFRRPDAVRAAYSAGWAEYLAAGLGVTADRLDVGFAYYAPELHSGPAARGDDPEELQDPLAKELMAEWLDALAAPAAVTQGAVALPQRYAASWVAEKYSLDARLTRWFVGVFFREVTAYLRGDDDPARLAAREEVAHRIARHRPRIVIAHSLGTVVAYEALHAHPELKVELLLTLGSPLALPRVVFDRLSPRPADGPTGRLGTRPEGVERWVNVADPGDPVATPPHLARAFHGIALDLTTTIHAGFDFYSVKNYLSCAETAATLGPYLADRRKPDVPPSTPSAFPDRAVPREPCFPEALPTSPEYQDAHLVEIWFGTNRQPFNNEPAEGFTGQRDATGRIHYGVCTVAIPKAHKFGSIGTPRWKRWRRLDFDDDTITVQARRSLDGSRAFFEDLRKELADSEGKQLLFYLHGYNTSFDEAARRAGQMFADLKVDGAAAFFSWPSKASTKAYLADGDRIADSEADIARFLEGLATELGGATVHIIAHSMGNRGLARAIQRITAAAASGAGVRFGQIILAAPDISVELFRDLARVYPAISQRTTMYVSARDRALELSRWLQDAPRAGFTPPVTVVPDIDTIEVSNIDLTLLGHGYYAQAAAVLYDIADLLKHGSAPASRVRLRPGPSLDPRSPYWVIGT